MSIARRAAYDFASQVGMQAVSLVAGILIARMFLAEGKGVWQAVMMAATIGTAFSHLGSRAANQYFVGKTAQWASTAHAAAIVLAALSALGCFVLVAALHPSAEDVARATAIPRDQVRLLGWAALVLPLMLYNYGWGGILIGLGRVRALAQFNFFFYLVQAVGWIAVLAAGGGIGHLLAVWAAAWIAALPVMLWLLRDCPPRPAGLGAMLRRMMGYGLVAFAGGLAANVMRFFNKLILLAFGNVALFSIFTTADTYALKFFLHADAMEKAAFASVTAAGREDALRLVCRLVRISLALGIVVWIGGGLAGSALLWLNGPQFVAGIAPLWILMLGPIAMGASRLIAIYFSGQLGRPRIPAVLAWIGAVVYVALVVAGVKLGGMTGAAAGTALSHLGLLILYIILLRGPMRQYGLRLGSLLAVQREDWALAKRIWSERRRSP